MAKLNFDSRKVNPATPRGDFEPLPVGRYVCKIIDSEWKDTKAGNGRYLELSLEVQTGQFARRLLWHRMNLDNPSAQAVEIAEGELSAICQAVGAPQITDSQQLHGRPLDVTVTQRKSDNGKVWNDCRGFGAVQPQVCATTTATYAPQQHVGQPQPQPMPPRQDPPPPPFPADGTDGPFAGDVGDTDDNPF